MPRGRWNRKRERQYKHIKQAMIARGEPVGEAEEIAARTVNKERAQAGEAEESSVLSIRDIPAGRRGGLRSHTGPGGRTREQLYADAKHLGIQGRSKMSKKQLQNAVNRRSGRRGP